MHGHPVAVVGAGRTDSGVHAMGQVASFHTDIASIPAEKFKVALNKLMDRDVRILDSREAPLDFHARFDARARRYRYFISCSGECPPFKARYAWRLDRRPNLATLNRMAAQLRGERDFTTFASARDPSANKSRYVHQASFRAHEDGLCFEISANAFLWRMVRSIVGSLVLWEREGSDETRVREALEARDRSFAGPSAPAEGLFLWSVDYYGEPTRPGRYLEMKAARLARETVSEKVVTDGDGRRIIPGYGPEVADDESEG
jgi:tRNA pseudouridine38-40 synthase